MTLSDDVKTRIDRPHFAHLATLMPDGSPSIAPVWVGREGDRIPSRELGTPRHVSRSRRQASSLVDPSVGAAAR
jgi:Pyridoxamine 5'-phosphate oxidase